MSRGHAALWSSSVSCSPLASPWLPLNFWGCLLGWLWICLCLPGRPQCPLRLCWPTGIDPRLVPAHLFHLLPMLQGKAPWQCG